MELNSMGFIRGYMSKSYSNEEFIIHVGETIERQLQEWDEAYQVNIMKFKDYIFIVKKGDIDYRVDISEQSLAELQNKSPYSLDKRIWLELKNQGLEIKMGYGDYLHKVL